KSHSGQDFKITYLKGTGSNLSKAFNLGIKVSSNKKILIMNSDCTFEKGQLVKICDLLDYHDVIKTKIRFVYGSYSEKLVSKMRKLFHEYFNDGKNLFGPGLAFEKTIKNKIGGYFYDEGIAWGEDGELTKRINHANLNLLTLKSHIVHAPETMAHDLRVAMKIGSGKRVADIKSNKTLNSGILCLILENLLDRKGHFRLSYKHSGIQLVCYLTVWKVAFLLGYVQYGLKPKVN
ncbi:MAG: hypothetical protein Q8M92_09900, partial [Candidatus Subteraquimicrobiales bacterium]|nr:hypothetical protein [Candidatus Subteraquimicrobiales bacterium]